MPGEITPKQAEQFKRPFRLLLVDCWLCSTRRLNFFSKKRRRNEKGEKREKKYWKNGKNLEGAKGSG
ncbi:hypothetical protein ACHWQZ_G016912 [Mnemiopsis leidyi]